MARDIEFGSRTVADGDNRRHKTVTSVEELPEWFLDRVTADASSSRDERISDDGQVPLFDDEHSRIDFSND